MPSLRVVAGLIVIIALAAALAFDSGWDVSIRPRAPEPLVQLTPDGAEPPLDLRLVDSGGVGIPMNGAWGSDYSHDRRTFRDVILESAPYVDDEAFRRVEGDWHAYVDRMREYGNNAMVVPLLIELLDFDRVPIRPNSPFAEPIYAPDSDFRARHAAVRQRFGELFDWTDRRGLQIFLDSDMLTLTPPLARYLRGVAPDASAVGIDTTNPAVWEVYRAGLDELFDRVPAIKGIIIRFGEGGNLYNSEGWPYRSEMAVRNATALRAMLRGLLPLFEARGKTLVLRNWTVGVGQLGRLHIDPKLYQSVLGDIDSPALVVSTKFTAGDFFSYLPLNPTLAVGRQRRIVELQAKPEFEGFGAFPNFLGDDHARALRLLRAANPRIVGAYVLSQFGGPLRAGPRTLYPLHGFWFWTDANVFVSSRLAAQPDADVTALTREWAAMRFGKDPRIVDAVTRAMRETRDAVRKGFYIRPFAERDVRVRGLELPPLMWIFEWNMVGGWHSLLSLVYEGTRDNVDVAIAEGHAAVDTVRRARQELHAAFASAGPDACPAICGETLRSLDYQETLFAALAAWRQAFLSYYRWLDTGDAQAWRDWRVGKEQFEAAAATHVARFGADPEFPAFDLSSASRAVATAERSSPARIAAAGVLMAALAMLIVVRRARATLNLRHAALVMLVTVIAIGVLVATLTSFSSLWTALIPALVFAIVSTTFETIAMPLATGGRRGRLLVASAESLLPGLIILLALVIYAGPVGVWYSFWMAPTFRIILLTVPLAMLLWSAYASCAACAVDGWRVTVGAAMAAAGAGLLALTVLLPDWAHVLRFLDRPLNVAPATDTMVFALQTYAGVTLDIGGPSRMIGGLLIAAGLSLRGTRPSQSSNGVWKVSSFS